MLEHFLAGVALAGSSLISFFVGLVVGGLWAATIYVAYIRKQKRKLQSQLSIRKQINDATNP